MLQRRHMTTWVWFNIGLANGLFPDGACHYLKNYLNICYWKWVTGSLPIFLFSNFFFSWKFSLERLNCRNQVPFHNPFSFNRMIRVTQAAYLVFSSDIRPTKNITYSCWNMDSVRADSFQHKVYINIFFHFTLLKWYRCWDSSLTDV